MAIRLLVCDLDGTLVDSFRDIATSCNLLLAEAGTGPLPDEAIMPCIGRGVRMLVEGILHKAGASTCATNAVLTRYREIYAEHITAQTRLYAGVRDALDVLRDRAADGVRLAVLSNKPEQATREILAAFGIDGHFSLIAGGDSFEEMKPSPLPLRRILEKLNVDAEQAAIVGDSVYDIEAGKAAGVRTIAALYGFQPPETLKALEPDHTVSAFAEILEIV
jgi:phosphoglycolate phosphatase